MFSRRHRRRSDVADARAGGGEATAPALEYAGPLPEKIECDPIRLRQILINLVGNAINDESGEVRLIVTTAENCNSASSTPASA